MRLIITIILSTSFTIAIAQKYTDKAVKQSCECMSKIDLTLSPKILEEKATKCIEEATISNLSGLVKEHDLDLTDEAAAEKVGEKIGMKLVAKCPAFISLAQKFPNDDEESKTTDYEFAEGKVSSVTKSDILIIGLEESTGDIRNFYLIDYFSGADEITADLNSIKNKKVKIGYVTKKIFDGASNDFKERKIIIAFEYWN